MQRVSLFIIAFLAFAMSFSQKKSEREFQDYLPTDNLEMGKDDNTAFNRPRKQRRYSYIYVPNGNNILYGNPCALEATRKMGFEYLVEPRNGNESKTSAGKFLNNLWVKTKLVFTRSPFWKLTLKKKFKQCRSQSGDFVG